MPFVAPLRTLTIQIALGLAGAIANIAAYAQAVEILLAEDGEQYREAREAVRAELGARADAKADRPRLRIALGTRALDTALTAAAGKGDSTPILATLVPRAAFEHALRAHPRIDARQASAIYLDQPFARQLALIRIALPGRVRIGVLTATESQDLTTLQTAAAAQRFTIARESFGASAELHPALRRLLGDSDVLLALPDQRVYNPSTIHNILATTFRAQVPLVGFSPAYVRAGALLAVYSSPDHLGRQVGRIAVRVLAGEALPAPQYPRAFAVSTNQTVARSLSVVIDDAASLTAKLVATERE